jgi:hypothetical protein
MYALNQIKFAVDEIRIDDLLSAELNARKSKNSDLIDAIEIIKDLADLNDARDTSYVEQLEAELDTADDHHRDEVRLLEIDFENQVAELNEIINELEKELRAAKG